MHTKYKSDHIYNYIGDIIEKKMREKKRERVQISRKQKKKKEMNQIVIADDHSGSLFSLGALFFVRDER